jgi:hypothetical protein
MFAMQRNAAYCTCRGEWGVAGNAPTVMAVIAKWVNFVANWGKISPQNRADTQVCPYENCRNAQKPPCQRAKFFLYLPSMLPSTQKTPQTKLGCARFWPYFAEIAILTPPPP